VAKTSLYRYFRSKDDLVVAVLERHETLWTVRLLEAESAQRAPDPDQRLAALLELFEEWLRDDGYGGCLLINSLLESRQRSPAIGAASVAAIERLYELLCRLAGEAHLSEPRSLAHQLQIIMRGSIVAAVEGNHAAVEEAHTLALQLLEQRPSQASRLE